VAHSDPDLGRPARNDRPGSGDQSRETSLTPVANDSPAHRAWEEALTRLIQAQERLAVASDAEKASLRMESLDALSAYLAISDEL